MESLKEKIREMEKEEIILALRECGWVLARAERARDNRKDDRIQDEEIRDTRKGGTMGRI